MSIQRWEPFNDMMSLRDAMDRLMEESFIRPMAGMSGAASMPMDVQETEDAFIVETTIPGARPEDVEISVHGDTLRVHADVTRRDDREGERWLLRERRFGHYERTLTLPTSIKADACSANFEHGVLTITLPKSEESKPRSIPVRSGSQSKQGQEVEVEGKQKK